MGSPTSNIFQRTRKSDVEREKHSTRQPAGGAGTPDHPLPPQPVGDRPFRPAKTPAGWIAYGEVPPHIRMDCQNQERLTGTYPTREAAATAAMPEARYVESEEDRIGQTENSSGGSRPRRF